MNAQVSGYFSSWGRKGHSEPRDPSPEEWAEYNRVKEAWESIKDSQYIDEGGPDYGVELREPSKTKWVYDETEEEYRNRVAAMNKESVEFKIINTRNSDG